MDAFELAARTYAGPLKVQLLGPWTLAANVELPGGEWSVADLSAVRDVAASLAEGMAAHVAELRNRVPGASAVLVELDEARLGAVLRGSVPTASGWARYPAVEELVAQEVESVVLGAAGGDAGVRFEGADPPIDVVRRAGARFLSMAGADLRPEVEDQLGEALEAGLGLFAGLVPPTDAGRVDLDELAHPARRLWNRLGLAPALLPEAVVVTPTSGLAGVAPDQAATVLKRCVELAGWLEEEYGAGG